MSRGAIETFVTTYYQARFGFDPERTNVWPRVVPLYPALGESR